MRNQFRSSITKRAAGLGRCAALLLALAGLVPAALGQTFSPKTDYPTGAGPFSVALADVNGDGRPDLVTTNRDANTASVRLNAGAGVFSPKTDYPTGAGPLSVALADLNGDGRLDLVTANFFANTASVLLGTGAGTFGPKTDYPAGTGSLSVALADVNGDGRPDLATANAFANTASVLLGTGAGVFGPKTDYPTGAAPYGVALADVNGDGRPDLVTVNTDANTASVRLNAGAGVFGAKTDYPTGVGPFSAALADVNGDGRPDLVTANYQDDTASVLLNAGAGVFGPKTDYPIGAAPYKAVLVDVNGDGRLDLVAAANAAASASVLLGTGTGAFGAKTAYPTGGGPSSVALADVNGDGRPDLATANYQDNTASVLLNTTTFLGPTLTAISPASGPVGTGVGLTGTNLSSAVSVSFNGTNAPGFVVNSNTSISVSVPTGATSGNVTVTTGGGTSNGVAFTVSSSSNNALAFDGTDDNVGIPNSAAFDLTTALTIETWLKPAGGGAATQDVLCKSSGSQNTGYIFPRTDDTWGSLRIWLHRGGGWSQYTVPYAANVGSWHHVAASYDGTTVRMYIDGVLVPSVATGTVTTGPVATNTNPLTLGNQPGFGEYYKGVLDETRVYNAVLTPAQIQADMFSTASALPGNQVAYYDFNQGVAGGNNTGVTTLPDASGNAHAGTLSNFALTGTASNWVRSFPTITGIAPTSGPVGTSVTVSGTNLLDATSFKFNGTAVAPFTTPTNDFSATATVPNGATTGPVSVASATLAAYNGPVFTLGLPDLIVNTGTQLSPTLIPAGAYNSITVTGTGNGVLAGNVSVAAFFTVQPGGGLSDGCSIISGPGTFTLGAGSILGICNPAGISGSGATGSVQVTGARSYSTGASYGYTGAAAVTGPGLPATVLSLAINTAGNVTLTGPVAVGAAVGVGGAGNLVLGGNALTLLSGASGTALAVNTGTGVVVGNATVQRYIDPASNTGLGYRHYAAPVNNTTVADLMTSGFTPEISQAATYNSSATPGAVTPFPTVYGYDQSRVLLTNSYAPFDRGFVAPTALSSPLLVGRGYTVNIGASQLVDFVGTLTTGDQAPLVLSRNAASTPNAADAGWQLLGNPYPAPLNYALVAAADRPGLDAAIYVYSSTGPYVGAYRTWVNGVGGNPVLPVAQGFFTRVSTGQTSASLTFRNSQRLTTSDPTPFQRPAADARPLVRLELRAATGLADVLYTYAETGATPAFDVAYDAIKLPNTTGLNLTSVASTGERLAIDGRPAFAVGTVLPLTVGVPAAGTYTFVAAALNNLPASLDAFLTDAATGQTVGLSQQPGYAFTVTAAQAATLLIGRFTLHFAARAALATAPALSAAQVALYPNPAHDQFTVAVPAVAGATQVRATLLNALGQVVRQQAAALPAAGAQLTVPTAGLAAGVYTLRLQAGSATLAKRVVVE